MVGVRIPPGDSDWVGLSQAFSFLKSSIGNSESLQSLRTSDYTGGWFSNWHPLSRAPEPQTLQPSAFWASPSGMSNGHLKLQVEEVWESLTSCLQLVPFILSSKIYLRSSTSYMDNPAFCKQSLTVAGWRSHFSDSQDSPWEFLSDHCSPPQWPG